MIEVEKIIIGWSLEAALLAFMGHHPLIICSDRKHTIKEWIQPDIDLSLIYQNNDIVNIKTNYGTFKIGEYKSKIIDEIHFLLSIMGLLYRGSIRNDNNKIIFYGSDGFSQIFQSQEVLIINPDDVPNLQNIEKTDSYEVYDFCNLGVHFEYDMIISGYKKFCQEIWFCDSQGDIRDLKRDCCIVSFLDKTEIHDPEYGDQIMRLMASDILKPLGIKKDLEYELRSVVDVSQYSAIDYDNVKFKFNLNVEEILKLDIHPQTKKIIEFYASSRR